MKENNLDLLLKTAAERHGELCRRSLQPHGESNETLATALEELCTALEELRVANEELRQQNEELVEARQVGEVERQRYQDLFESAPDGYVVADAEGVILEANRIAAALFGVQQGFLLGKPLAVFVGPDTLKEFHTWVTQLHKNGLASICDKEIIIQPRYGTAFPVAVSVGRMLDRTGRLVGLRCLLRDISERVHAEEARRKFAEHKLESLGMLAGGIAHNFNNVLMAVLGNAELATLEVLPGSAAHRRLTAITKAAQRAVELTSQMLAYAGKGRFLIEPINLSALIEEMSTELKAAIPPDCVLNCHCADQLPPIEANARQIRQVILSLVRNAVEAIGAQHGEVTVSTSATYENRASLAECTLDDDLSEGHYVILEVSDTGCGMDRATQEKMFDPFFSTKFPGRGLELAAVLGIVRGQRGALKIHSLPGQGTTVKVLFPCAQDSSATASE